MSLIGRLRRFRKADDGAVLVLVTLALPVILGLGAMVVDLGRVAAEQTELQAFTDHVALAAAAELDGEVGAIARAQTAASTFITADRQTFGDGGAALAAVVDGDVAFRFLRSLPADDDAPIDASHVTTLDEEAAFVEVTVTPHTVTHFMAEAFAVVARLGRADAWAISTDVGATAVAGFTEYVCDVTPLMFCLPTDPNVYATMPGRMISLKSDSSWAPGAFGLLDNLASPDGPCGNPNQGASFWRCATALIEGATTCTPRRAGVDIRPGSVSGPTESGLNVRFDIFGTSLNGEKSNPNFAPAPNVVKGVLPNGGGGCINNNFVSSPDTVSLPRDTCFATNSCPAGRYGDGVWDEAGYLATNHPDGGPAGHVPGGTRYQLYLTEIAAAGAGDVLPSGLSETGRAQCASSMSPDPDRRVLVAAAIDCSTLPGGNAAGVPVEDYWRIFMTEPAGLSGNGDVWVEVIERVDPFGAGAAAAIIQDVTQLYR